MTHCSATRTSQGDGMAFRDIDAVFAIQGKSDDLLAQKSACFLGRRCTYL